jgi:hypothetical protein
MDLYVCWSIDCESCRIDDTALGSRAMEGFCGILDEYGWKGTLFIIPEEIRYMADVIGRAVERGHEAALHLHPAQSGCHTDHIGECSYDEQLEITLDAIDIFKKSLGIVPVSVRPGYGSANDSTVKAMTAAGIRQGSMSFPGRKMTGLAANWSGAPLFTHYMHPDNRFLEDGCDFVELPISVDWETMIWGGVHPQDLRVEFTDSGNHGYVIRKVMKRQSDEDLPFKAVMPFTHNIFDYSDKSDFRSVTMRGMTDEMLKTGKGLGFGVKGISIEQAAGIYRRAVPFRGE